jgi:tRNA pseudouridine38-40 synthase
VTHSRNLLILIQFNGTGFSGWQEQDGPRTVQEDVRRAVETMVGHPVALSGSSRTDKGVHASALAANFKTDSTIPVEGFRRGLNATLSDDLAIVSVQEVEPDFDARHNAVAKTYRYRLLIGETRLPHHHWNTWYMRGDLDLEAMRDAAARLLGVHRFGAFRARGCTSHTAERRMYAIEVTGPEEGEAPVVVIAVTGNAFLRNMVRILAGTLVEVGEGRRTPESIDVALDSQDRPDAGITAPPQGLTLETVHFEGYPRLGKPNLAIPKPG